MKITYLFLTLGVALGGCAVSPGYVEVDDGPYLYGGPDVDVGLGFFGFGGGYGGDWGGGRHGHHGGGHGGGHHGGGHHGGGHGGGHHGGGHHGGGHGGHR